jgi:hypothetical protein
MRNRYRALWIFFGLLFVVPLGLASQSAQALTYCVDDEADGPAVAANCDATCTDGTNNCSMRDALTAANTNVGLDNIVFAIPGAGVHTLLVTMAQGKLPQIISPVNIDGYTQPGSSPNTNGPGQGSNAVLNIEIVDNVNGCCDDLLGLGGVGSSGSTIKGLVLNEAGGNQFYISGSNNNTIEGNFFGTNPDGTTSTPTGAGITIIGGSGNIIGGTTPAARNLIAGNDDFGLFIGGTGATNNMVLGNLIGTDRNGTADLGNANGGIRIVNFGGAATGNFIGGSTPAERNIISGNSSNGVRIFGAGVSDNSITGNFIGLDVTGTAGLGNSSAGIRVDTSAFDNFIGSTGIGEGNTIAFNGGGGVLVASGTGNAIFSNSIFSNTGLGISLMAGAGNNGQAAPVLTLADSTACETNLQGTLASTPDTDYRIEFFSNPAGPDIEGMTFVGFTTVMTDGMGDANFDVILPVIIASGQFITATATDTSSNINDSSQFSNSVEVIGSSNPGTLQFSSDGYSVNEDGGTATIIVTRVGGSDCPVSVDYSTSDGSAIAGLDYVLSMGTLNWVDGESADQSFTVDILDDTLVEGDETVNLALANPMGAALGIPDMAVLTIIDTDPSAPTILFSPISGAGCNLTLSGANPSMGSMVLCLLLLLAMSLLKRHFHSYLH